MKTPNSSDLRALAEEMDKLERMERWSKELLANGPGNIALEPRISWAWASACNGYSDFVSAVEGALRDGLMYELLRTALVAQRMKVAELQEQVLGS